MYSINGKLIQSVQLRLVSNVIYFILDLIKNNAQNPDPDRNPCRFCTQQYAWNFTVVTAFERNVVWKNHRPHAPAATPEVYM